MNSDEKKTVSRVVRLTETLREWRLLLQEVALIARLVAPLVYLAL
jgi:hypothetical protein